MKSKHLGLMALSLLGVDAFAAPETVDGSTMARLFSDQKTMACLAQLHDFAEGGQIMAPSLSDNYGRSTGTFDVVRDDAKGEIRTSVEYMILSSPSSLKGKAQITIFEKLVPYGGMVPSDMKYRKVSGCQFSVKR